MTASPAQRVVMLYGHLLLKLRLARQAISGGAPSAHIEPLEKAHAILEELLYSLDHEQGGELAETLSGLYECLMEHTLKVVGSRDLDALDRITAMVADLHRSWARVADEAAPALSAAS